MIVLKMRIKARMAAKVKKDDHREQEQLLMIGVRVLVMMMVGRQRWWGWCWWRRVRCLRTMDQWWQWPDQRLVDRIALWVVHTPDSVAQTRVTNQDQCVYVCVFVRENKRRKMRRIKCQQHKRRLADTRRQTFKKKEGNKCNNTATKAAQMKRAKKKKRPLVGKQPMPQISLEKLQTHAHCIYSIWTRYKRAICWYKVMT